MVVTVTGALSGNVVHVFLSLLHASVRPLSRAMALALPQRACLLYVSPLLPLDISRTRGLGVETMPPMSLGRHPLLSGPTLLYSTESVGLAILAKGISATF